MKFARYLIPLATLAGACHKPPPPLVYQSVPVEKRDIIVTAQASGAINPDTTVQVKSKASGEILDIKVQTGDLVKHGTLIVQVDQRIPLNDVATAKAALQVDSAQLLNARGNFKRQQDLFNQKAVTQQDFEAAQLAVSVANAAVVRDAIQLQNANISLEDTRVLAPITGTVIEQEVQRGTVISSPTNSASGGTVLLTMADLQLVQVKTWVDETDVGKLRAGMQADVTVAAFPNRPFKGEILKIEPQADTIQNVTMFPVDVRIDNKDGMLKPGMNADVRIGVGQRLGVLAIPNAALRTERDVMSAGTVLGIASTDLTKMLADAKKTFADAQAVKADTGVAAAELPKPDAGAAASDTSAHKNGGGRGRGGNGGAGGKTGAGASDTSSHKGGGGRGRGGNATGNAGAGGNGGGNAGAAGNGGGAAGAAGGGGGGGRRGGGRGSRGGSDFQFGGRYIVFAMRGGKPMPVYVQTGLTDMDYSEVKSGLTEADSVLLLPSASLVNSQQQMQQRMSQNSGLPGQTKAPATTPPAGAAPPTKAPTGGKP